MLYQKFVQQVITASNAQEAGRRSKYLLVIRLKGVICTDVWRSFVTCTISGNGSEGILSSRISRGK